MRLRVTSGSLGGRQFDAPKGHKTHPMSEKIRSAVFNMLGDISELEVLDAYSGSGALAFESISRGAKKVYAIEKDKGAFSTIKNNKDLLRINDELSVSMANVSSWLKTQSISFDIIFCDPPYDEVKISVLEQAQNYLNDGGIMVCSLPTELVNDVTKNLTRLKQITIKKYANASILILQK